MFKLDLFCLHQTLVLMKTVTHHKTVNEDETIDRKAGSWIKTSEKHQGTFQFFYWLIEPSAPICSLLIRKIQGWTLKLTKDKIKRAIEIPHAREGSPNFQCAITEDLGKYHSPSAHSTYQPAAIWTTSKILK